VAVNARKALQLKRALESGKIVELDREIEVGVRPRLFTKESIYPPSSINPEGKICVLEGTAKGYDGLKLHWLHESRTVMPMEAGIVPRLCEE